MKDALPKLILPLVLTLLSVGLALGMTLLIQRVRAERSEPETGETPEII
ncbi:MAG: hypothetical protein ACXVAE_05350 [Candidatus Limnocylindrales bacterium]